MGVFLFLDTSKFIVDLGVVVSSQSCLFFMTQMYEVDNIFRCLFCTLQIVFLKYIYYRVQRQAYMNFLREKTQHELIDQIIPMQLFVINYNSITQRIELIDSNIRAKTINSISSDEKLDAFISSAQLNFLNKQTRKSVTLKQFLLEFLIKLEEKKQEPFVNHSDLNNMIAYQICQQNGNTIGKYKVKILPRGQKKSQVIVALEDLTQIEELKIIKKKARLADQHLQIFFEFFKKKFGNFFHAFEISCSVSLDDPMKQLMQAKRQTSKLFNTVQNIAEFRKQDNEEQGVYSTTQFNKRKRMKSVNPNSIANFNFCSFIEELKNMYPLLSNSFSSDLIKSPNSNSSDVHINMYSDLEKLKAIYMTLFSQFEESLPERIFKEIKISYQIQKEVHYEEVKVNIVLPVPLDWLRTSQLKKQNSTGGEKEMKQNKVDCCDCLKSLLNYFNQENIEIRDIEIAMLKFYLSQMSPYEMQIKEEVTEIDTQRLSNSFIGNTHKENMQTSELVSNRNNNDILEVPYSQMPTNRIFECQDNSPNSQISTNRQYEVDNESPILDLNRNHLRKESQSQEASFIDIESQRRSFISKPEQENPIQQFKNRRNDKKLSYFFKQAKQPNIGQFKDYKNIIISMSFFKDIRVMLDLNCRQSSVNSNQNHHNHQNILDVTQLPILQLGNRSSLTKNSNSNIILPSTSPKKPTIAQKMVNIIHNLNIPQSPLSVRSSSSNVESPTFQKERCHSTNSVPQFLPKTLEKLNKINENIPRIKHFLQKLVIDSSLTNSQDELSYKMNNKNS